MTPAEAIAALDALTGDDPEVDHRQAEEILLELAGPDVAAAYERLSEQRANWWAHA